MDVAVRETLSEDLLERLIVDTLEATESLMGVSALMISSRLLSSLKILLQRPMETCWPQPRHPICTSLIKSTPAQTKPISATPTSPEGRSRLVFLGYAEIFDNVDDFQAGNKIMAGKTMYRRNFGLVYDISDRFIKFAQCALNSEYLLQ